jgi:hypothetical protein
MRAEHRSRVRHRVFAFADGFDGIWDMERSRYPWHPRRHGFWFAAHDELEPGAAIASLSHDIVGDGRRESDVRHNLHGVLGRQKWDAAIYRDPMNRSKPSGRSRRAAVRLMLSRMSRKQPEKVDARSLSAA